jgi:hypothetical protein
LRLVEVVIFSNPINKPDTVAIMISRSIPGIKY